MTPSHILEIHGFVIRFPATNQVIHGASKTSWIHPEEFATGHTSKQDERSKYEDDTLA